MNISLPKKLSSALHRGHHDKYRDFNPDRNWRRTIITCIVLSVILAGASAYIYFQVKGGNFFTLTQTTTTEVTTVNRDKLTETVNFFEAKRARFEAEKNAPGTYVDPGV